MHVLPLIRAIRDQGALLQGIGNPGEFLFIAKPYDCNAEGNRSRPFNKVVCMGFSFGHFKIILCHYFYQVIEISFWFPIQFFFGL